MTPDRALIYAILKGGIPAFNLVRRRGVKADDLFGDDVEIFKLFEKYITKGRIPTVEEIALFTSGKIALPSHDGLIDPDISAEAIAKRSLTKKLNDGVGQITDEITKDPFKARADLSKLVHETVWSQGNIQSTNLVSSIEEVESRYLEAELHDGGLLGLSSPWKSLDGASLGLQNGEVSVVFAKRKTGKCVEKNTIIHDPVTGHENTIAELVKKGEGKVLTWDKNQPIKSTIPSHYIATGIKECLKVRFKSGRELTVTPEHPFMTPSGWRQAENLIVGHHIAAVKNLPEPLHPHRLENHEIIVLANMIAEGGCTKHSTPTFTNIDENIIDSMFNALDNMNCQLKEIKKGNFWVTRKDTTQRSNNVVSLLTKHEVMGKKSIHKTIPDDVFGLPNDQLALFLGHYWSCDGCIDKRGNISASTGSKKMAFQLQHLLLRFGITSKVRKIWRKVNHGQNKRRYYEILVHKECLKIFKDYIKLTGYKAGALAQSTFCGLSRIGWIRTAEIKEIVYREINERPHLLLEIEKRLGYKFRFQRGHIFDSKSDRTRRRVFKAFCDVYHSPLKWILSEDIWWDEIVKITNVGVREVYDLTVEKTHCFIANDIIVHNTWAMLAWANHIWQNDLKQGENILFISMEMPPWQINRRLFAIRNKLDYSLFRKGKLPADQRARFIEWCRLQKEADPKRPEVIVVGSDVVRTVPDLVGIVAQYRPKAVFVDGFYILGKDQRKQIWERTLENVQAIKLDAAVNLNLPFVISTQLSGQVGKQDLDADADAAAYAKAIGDYADACYGIFADDAFKAAEKRVLRVMEAREFVPIDLQINFSQSKQDYSEIKVMGKKDIDFSIDNAKIDTNLPDFNEDDQLAF